MDLDDTETIVDYILDHPDQEVEAACADALRQRGIPRKKAIAAAESFSRIIVENADDAVEYSEELLSVVCRILRDRGEGELADQVADARQVIAHGLHAAKAVTGTDVEALGAGGAVN